MKKAHILKVVVSILKISGAPRSAFQLLLVRKLQLHWVNFSRYVYFQQFTPRFIHIEHVRNIISNAVPQLIINIFSSFIDCFKSLK